MNGPKRSNSVRISGKTAKLASQRRCLLVESLERRLLLSANSTADSDSSIDANIRFSASGKAYYFDPVVPSKTLNQARNVDRVNEEPPAADAASNGATAETAMVPLAEVPIYNSNLGAPHDFFLDFNGHITTASDWVSDNEGLPIHSVAFDLDGDTTAFSPDEIAAIDEIFQRVAEDYSPFDINITTVEPEEAEFRLGRGAIRAVISNNVDDEAMGGSGETWFDDAGGVAFISSWIWAGDVPVFVFHNMLPETNKAIAEATSHELGHSVGLSHDGVAGNAYYEGHGAGDTGWAPIMGAAYHREVSQWSRGDYTGATNREDDISIITNPINKITFREDDHGQANEDATPLEFEGNAFFQSGVIENETDYDVFTFEHPGGPIELHVSPPDVGPNVDVMLELFDENDDAVFDDVIAPEESLTASIEVEDLAAGRYYLLVDGDGYRPASGQGYNDYASIGTYEISGFVGLPDNTPELVADAGGPYVLHEGTDLRLDGTNSSGSPTSYSWDLDNDGNHNDVWQSSPLVTWDVLEGLLAPKIGREYVISISIANAAEEISVDTATLTIIPREHVLSAKVASEFVVDESIRANFVFTDDVSLSPNSNAISFLDSDGVVVADQNATVKWIAETHTAEFVHPPLAAGEYTLVLEADGNTDSDWRATISVRDVTRPGDANLDGVVGFADFLAVSANFGQANRSWAFGDFNGDGEVSFADFLILSAAFGDNV